MPRKLLARHGEALRRPRAMLAVFSGAVVLAGVLVRSAPGFVGDAGGGILYAVLVFLLVAMLIPAAPTVRIGAIALAVCVVVEVAQLTGLPGFAAGLIPPLRYVFGTTFVASDLLAYAGGVLIAVAADRLVIRSIRRRSDERTRRAQ